MLAGRPEVSDDASVKPPQAMRLFASGRPTARGDRGREKDVFYGFVRFYTPDLYLTSAAAAEKSDAPDVPVRTRDVGGVAVLEGTVVDESVRAALAQLDGSSKSAVALLAGVSAEEIDECGGMPDEGYVVRRARRIASAVRGLPRDARAAVGWLFAGAQPAVRAARTWWSRTRYDGRHHVERRWFGRARSTAEITGAYHRNYRAGADLQEVDLPVPVYWTGWAYRVMEIMRDYDEALHPTTHHRFVCS